MRCDPSLELGFPSRRRSTSASTVSRSASGAGGDRAVTKIGDEIIVHDAALAHQPELDEAIDAARLALERGSLRSLEATARREIALLDAIPDNVYRTSADGTLLEAHVKGTGAEEVRRRMVGRRIDEVVAEIAVSSSGRHSARARHR